MWVSPLFLMRGGLKSEDENFYIKAFKICRFGYYKSYLIDSGYKDIVNVNNFLDKNVNFKVGHFYN